MIILKEFHKYRKFCATLNHSHNTKKYNSNINKIGNALKYDKFEILNFINSVNKFRAKN